MDPKEWATILDALRILAPGLTAIVIFQLRKLMGAKEHIERRLDALEAWHTHHDRMDDVRFSNLETLLEEYRKELRK